jgi:hypothetical protein
MKPREEDQNDRQKNNIAKIDSSAKIVLGPGNAIGRFLARFCLK